MPIPAVAPVVAPPPIPAVAPVPAPATAGGTIRLAAPAAPATQAQSARRRTTPWALGGGPSRYLELLPVIFQAAERPGAPSFLARYLKIFEAIWEPLEQRQDFIEAWFHPATCPEPFLDLLARWVGVELLPGLPVERRRTIVLNAPELHRQRGTLRGLRMAIGLYTGLSQGLDLRNHETEAFCLVVRAPRSGVGEDVLVAVIELYKPAHIAYYLELF